MSMRAVTALGVLLSLLSSPLAAQELIGFDLRDKGKIVLSHRQSGVELELAMGHYNNESIRNYSPNSIFSRLGRSVGRLDIYTDVQIFPCTAFIVSEKHILTNYHCVPGVIGDTRTKATRIEGVRFLAGYTQQGVEEDANLYEVNPVPIEAHEDLDYAVLEVMGNPSARFGTLKLASATPNDADPYWIIGHPMGEAQRISREECRAETPAVSAQRLRHTCDTLPGNSGSPVIDAGLQTVIGLHHAGSSRDSVNFAIPMELILQRSKVLSVATPPATADAAPAVTADPATLVCDALFAEARSSKDCLSYDVFAETCASHPLVAIATRYRVQNCGSRQVAAPAPTPTPETPAPASGLEQELARVLKKLDAEGERALQLDQQLTRALQELNVAKIVRNADKIFDAQNKVASLSRALDASVSRSTKLRLQRSDLMNRMPLRAAAPRGPDWEGGSVTFTALPYRASNDTFRDSSRAVNAARDRVAIGRQFGQILIWDAVAGRIHKELDFGSRETEAITFDPAGTFIVAGRDDGSVVVVDVASGALRHELPAHDKRIKSVAVSPDGSKILTTSGDATARIFDSATGRLLTTFAGHDRSVTTGAFSPDGRRVYTGSADKTVIAWATASGAVEQTFTGHTHWITSLAVSPDGSRLITGAADKTARIWNTASGAQLSRIDHHDWVLSVDFGPDGTLVATSSRDKAVRIVDLAQGRVRRRLSDRSGTIRFAPDGRSLVAWDQYGVGIYRLN